MKNVLELFNGSWHTTCQTIKNLCKTIKDWKRSNNLATLPWEDKDIQQLYDELKDHKEHIEYVLEYIEDYVKNGGKCDGFDLKITKGKSSIEDIKKTLMVCSEYGIDSKELFQFVHMKISTFRPFFVKHLVKNKYVKTIEEATEIYDAKMPVIRFDDRKQVRRLLNESKKSKEK